MLAPLHVRSVERPSNTSITWRSTGDYTPGRSRSSARNVASASVTQGRTASTWTTATSTVNRSERTASAPPKARGACNVQLDYKLLSFILIRDQSPMNYDAIFVKWKFDMIFALSLGNFFLSAILQWNLLFFVSWWHKYHAELVTGFLSNEHYKW